MFTLKDGGFELIRKNVSGISTDCFAVLPVVEKGDVFSCFLIEQLHNIFWFQVFTCPGSRDASDLSFEARCRLSYLPLAYALRRVVQHLFYALRIFYFRVIIPYDLATVFRPWPNPIESRPRVSRDDGALLDSSEWSRRLAKGRIC